MIRKALNDANMSQVAILSLNMKGMNKQPGFQPGLGFWHRLIMGMIYGDACSRSCTAPVPMKRSRYGRSLVP